MVAFVQLEWSLQTRLALLLAARRCERLYVNTIAASLQMWGMWE